jgi:hypothetical protein
MNYKVHQVGSKALGNNEKQVQPVLDKYSSEGWKLHSFVHAHGFFILTFEKE